MSHGCRGSAFSAMGAPIAWCISAGVGAVSQVLSLPNSLILICGFPLMAAALTAMFLPAPVVQRAMSCNKIIEGEGQLHFAVAPSASFLPDSV